MTPLSTFSTPDARFDMIHLDLVGPLPPSKGYTYLLTCIDRFTRSFPLTNITAQSVAEAFMTGWIARFGTPSTITTAQLANVAVGAVLQQRIADQWQPISYFSKKLKPPERRYSTFDRVLFTSLFGISGTWWKAATSVLTTDHKPLHLVFMA